MPKLYPLNFAQAGIHGQPSVDDLWFGRWYTPLASNRSNQRVVTIVVPGPQPCYFILHKEVSLHGQIIPLDLYQQGKQVEIKMIKDQWFQFLFVVSLVS